MGFLKCAVYAAAIGFLSFLLGRVLPRSWFRENSFLFKTRPWEKNGAIYNTVFKIKTWQAKVPDMSRYFSKIMPAKKITADFPEVLPRMITETCIAEGIHWLLCLGAPAFLWLWPGRGGILFMTAYILLGNLPFILIQRYNRPRFVRLREKLARKGERKETTSCQL